MEGWLGSEGSIWQPPVVVSFSLSLIIFVFFLFVFDQFCSISFHFNVFSADLERKRAFWACFPELPKCSSTLSCALPKLIAFRKLRPIFLGPIAASWCAFTLASRSTLAGSSVPRAESP